MANASQVGVDNAGGGLIGTAGVNTKLTAQGALLAIVGDPIAPHAPGGPHNAATVLGASLKLSVQGAFVGRAGDLATCGDPLTGSSLVNVLA